MYRFEHPSYLYLLPGWFVLAAVFVLYIRQKQRDGISLGAPVLIQQLIQGAAKGKPYVRFVLWSLAYFLLVICLAQPQWSTRSEPATRKGVHFFVAIDISNSMLAEDDKPNRMEHTRQFVSRLIGSLKGDEVGLIVFAGRAYMQIPLTEDYGAVKTLLKGVGPRLAGTQGTNIAGTIELAMNSFPEASEAPKVLLIISDGEAHEGESLSAARSASAKGLIIHTMGVGTPAGAPVPDLSANYPGAYKRDRSGANIISKRNDEMLKQISAAGNGKYFDLTRGDDVDDVTRELNALEKAEFEQTVFTDFEEQYQWFLLLAMLLLIADFLLGERGSNWLAGIKWLH